MCLRLTQPQRRKIILNGCVHFRFCRQPAPTPTAGVCASFNSYSPTYHTGCDIYGHWLHLRSWAGATRTTENIVLSRRCLAKLAEERSTRAMVRGRHWRPGRQEGIAFLIQRGPALSYPYEQARTSSRETGADSERRQET